MKSASKRSRANRARHVCRRPVNDRSPRSPRPAHRVADGRHAGARTTSSDAGTSVSRARSSRPSYADGCRVTTVGVQPAAARCGASNRTRSDAALESGGKWGLTINTRRMEVPLTARLHADARAVAHAIRLFDAFKGGARNAAVEEPAGRWRAE